MTLQERLNNEDRFAKSIGAQLTEVRERVRLRRTYSSRTSFEWCWSMSGRSYVYACRSVVCCGYQ